MAQQLPGGARVVGTVAAPTEGAKVPGTTQRVLAEGTAALNTGVAALPGEARRVLAERVPGTAATVTWAPGRGAAEADEAPA